MLHNFKNNNTLFVHRYQVSVRAETAMLSSLFQAGGIDIDMLNISKLQMARKNHEIV